MNTQPRPDWHQSLEALRTLVREAKEAGVGIPPDVVTLGKWLRGQAEASGGGVTAPVVHAVVLYDQEKSFSAIVVTTTEDPVDIVRQALQEDMGPCKVMQTRLDPPHVIRLGSGSLRPGRRED